MSEPVHDPAAVGPALTRLLADVATDPVTLMGAAAHLTTGMVAAAVQAGSRAMGFAADPDAEPAPAKGDRRFRDPTWDRHPWFLWQRQSYLAWAGTMQQLARGSDDGKAEFAVGQLVDAVAPTNFLGTNPAALRKAFETRGASVVEGLANMLDDLAGNDGRPSQVDRSAFEVGRDLACTPGKVVFRNDLFELIQYQPATKTTFEVPLLLSPPWINRYYIMDLAPGRSFVQWAVDHGHSTFALSYRNPDSSMRDVDLDDYLLLGLRAALDAVCEITGAPRVNIAGLCVGGTLAVMLAAFLSELGDDRINSTTLLNTLVDFSQPGPLRHFTDPEAVARVEELMAGPGYLPARELATTFDALRPNDLIWNYVGANWLMGEKPPAFDILAWNADATRVPEATHSTYLRACYLENRLAAGTMVMGGRAVRPSAVTSDTYVLAAEGDHITPWLSSYSTTGLVGGPVRFVLTSAGHIAGIVNPPGPKRKYWTNDDVGADPHAWRAGAKEHGGSWWEDWAGWIKARAGKRRQPFRIGGDDYPVLADAPGTYVRS
jgi:polyhydroxyalkanoate synthase